MVVTEQVQEVERPSEGAITAAVYAALVMLGLVMGVVGAFQHSWYVWPVPVSAVGCVLVLFAVCSGAGRAMRGRAAALVPAAAWLVVTMIFLGGRPEGDVVIANNLAGYLYLYGGLAAILAAVLLSPASGGGSWLLNRPPYGSRPADPR